MEEVIFHFFPKDEVVKKKWIVFADRGEGWPNVKNEVVLLDKPRPLLAHHCKTILGYWL